MRNPARAFVDWLSAPQQPVDSHPMELLAEEAARALHESQRRLDEALADLQHAIVSLADEDRRL